MAESTRKWIPVHFHLQVLLVSDETTDKSAAALDVHIGHMSDPNNLPGLAHFCEHMLFLGRSTSVTIQKDSLLWRNDFQIEFYKNRTAVKNIDHIDPHPVHYQGQRSSRMKMSTASSSVSTAGVLTPSPAATTPTITLMSARTTSVERWTGSRSFSSVRYSRSPPQTERWTLSTLSTRRTFPTTPGG